MPYQVVLAAADLTVGMTDYDWLPRVQLRDRSNRMIARGSQRVSNRVGGAKGGRTAWWIELAEGGRPPPRPIQIGDTVTFRSASDNGRTYLSRTGAYVRFDAVVSGQKPPSRAQWILQSTDPKTYPNGTRIVFGKTPFVMTSVDSGPTRHLKSKKLGLRSYGGRGSDAVWTMTWACTAGDVCSP
jgi:hypothetical protein